MEKVYHGNIILKEDRKAMVISINIQGNIYTPEEECW